MNGLSRQFHSAPVICFSLAFEDQVGFFIMIAVAGFKCLKQTLIYCGAAVCDRAIRICQKLNLVDACNVQRGERPYSAASEISSRSI